ncbi:hypothetical protein C8R42DRAFT_654228 [Lentinula raphanica]|nr:hypothetical protein C8R42DRAFT_654228 [Lentinula raphanica]
MVDKYIEPCVHSGFLRYREKTFKIPLDLCLFVPLQCLHSLNNLYMYMQLGSAEVSSNSRYKSPDVSKSSSSPPSVSMVSTRRKLAEDREQRPLPCRPIKERKNDEEDHEDQTNASRNKSGGGSQQQGIDLSWFDKARLRVIAAAVSGFRCLLTLESGLTNKDLNFIHFLAKTTSPVVLICLEYSWGLYPSHINVNTYLNIDIMRMDLHHSFDAGIFFFLPSIQVLQAIFEFTEYNATRPRTRDKKKFYEEFSDATWTYDMFTISFDPQRSIHRRNVDTTIRLPNDIARHPDKGGYTEHKFPFNTMRNLVSHVHPFFVVANAYLHLYKLTPRRLDRLRAENETIRLVWQIGSIWLKPVPASFKDTKKGGENEMLDPEKDRVSFLADKDSHGNVKYQHNKVFYRRMLEWADSLRSSGQVFSKTIPTPATVTPSTPPPPASCSRTTRARANTTLSRPSTSKRRLDSYDSGEPGRLPKKGRLATTPAPSTPTPRRSDRNTTPSISLATLKTEINAYPSDVDIEIGDGKGLLLEFISAQIKALHNDSMPNRGIPSTSDEEEIIDIAFRVLESQAADETIEGNGFGELQADLPPSRRQASPQMLSTREVTSHERERSTTLVLEHVEIPQVVAGLSGAPVSKSSSGFSHPSYPKSLEFISDTDTETEPDCENIATLQNQSPKPDSIPIPVSKTEDIAQARALSTIPPLSRKLTKRPMSSKLIAKASDLEKIPLSDAVPVPSSLPHATTVDSITSSLDDQSVFIRVGQQVVFERLAQECGRSVEEVSGIYGDVEDLGKTRKVLSRISSAPSFTRSASSSDKPTSTPHPSSLYSNSTRALPMKSPSLEQSPHWWNSGSLGESSTTPISPSFSPSSNPSNPTRVFLVPPRTTKKRLSSASSVDPVFDMKGDALDDGDAADESDTPLASKTGKNVKKRKISGYPSSAAKVKAGLPVKPRPKLKSSRPTTCDHTDFARSSPCSTVKSAVSSSSASELSQSQQRTNELMKQDTRLEPSIRLSVKHESVEQTRTYANDARLDSLTRSIELILRNQQYAQ